MTIGSVTTLQCGKFVFETTSLNRAMHSAFLRRASFPPPTPGPRVSVAGYSASTWAASDRFVALVVQFIVRDIVGADIIPYLGFGPIRQRGKLDDSSMIMVDLDLADVGPRRPLIAPQPCDPRVKIHQRPPQWQDLPDLATEQAQVNIAIK